MFLQEGVFGSMNGIDDFGQDGRQPVSNRQIRKRSTQRNKIKEVWGFKCECVVICIKHLINH